METKMEKKQRAPKGSKAVRKEKRGGKLVWGYHVWLRQPDGSRKQVRDFSFTTQDEAKEALRAIQTAGRKERYGLVEPKKQLPTTIQTAVTRYRDLSQSKRISRRTEDTTYWRDHPGHVHTLDRFGRWAETERKILYITEVDDEIIQYWMSAEVLRAEAKGRPIKQSTIKRGLNTILAALRGAKNSNKFDDLINYRVPANPLKKWQVEEDRDRILNPEELAQISNALAETPEYEEALFFLQLALMSGGRFAELKRMKWDESSERFGIIKLKAIKTGGRTRSIKVPGAAELIAQRKAAKLGGPQRVLTKEYGYFKDTFKAVSENLEIPYGQRVQGGWTIHDLRHTCLSNLALDGMPLHAIKEFAGHANISETLRYLKYMPQQIELGAKVTSKLGLLAGAKLKHTHGEGDIQCPNCNFTFNVKKSKHLKLVEQAS